MDSQLLKSIVTGIVRWAITALCGWLIALGVFHEGQFTDAQITLLVGGVTGLLITLGLAVWRKIDTKYKILAALHLPSYATPEEVKAKANELNPLVPTKTETKL